MLWDIANEVDFSKFGQVKNSKSLNDLKAEINAQAGTSEVIKNWIEANKKAEIQAIGEFSKLADIIRKFDEIKTDVDSYLAAFQIIDVANAKGKHPVKWLLTVLQNGG